MSLRGRITEHRSKTVWAGTCARSQLAAANLLKLVRQRPYTRAASVHFDEARQEGPTGPLQLDSRVHTGTLPRPGGAGEPNNYRARVVSSATCGLAT